MPGCSFAGRDKSCYWHERFIRGKRHLCRSIRRVKIKGTRVRQMSSPEDEPDFYGGGDVEQHQKQVASTTAGTPALHENRTGLKIPPPAASQLPFSDVVTTVEGKMLERTIQQQAGNGVNGLNILGSINSGSTSNDRLALLQQAALASATELQQSQAASAGLIIPDPLLASPMDNSRQLLLEAENSRLASMLLVQQAEKQECIATLLRLQQEAEREQLLSLLLQQQSVLLPQPLVASSLFPNSNSMSTGLSSVTAPLGDQMLLRQLLEGSGSSDVDRNNICSLFLNT